VKELDHETKKCIYCGENIYAHARRCNYCGSIMQKQNIPLAEEIMSEQISIDFFDEVVKVSHKEIPTSKKLSNQKKVYTTAFCSIVPGLGQIIGAIAGIAYMNEEDEDMRSFGMALLAVSVVVFILTLGFYFVLGLALTK
jgi:hypothetical protein